MTIRVSDLEIAIGDRLLLQGAQFEIPNGALTVLIGQSGGGKSSLLRVLAGLEPKEDPSARIFWSGERTWASSSGEAPRIGLVFQQPALLDELTALENVQLALDHRTRGSAPSPRSDHDSAKWWLEHLSVPMKVPIARLSGGQRQRLSLAQVLASKPQFLIYDEPTTGLDGRNAQRVAELIRQVQEEEKITSLVVTHDYASFLPIADHWLILDPVHRSIESSTPEEIPIRLERLQYAKEASSSIQPGLEGAKVNEEGPKRAKTSRWLLGVDTVGRTVEGIVGGVFSILPRYPQWKWGCRFLLHYANLVFGLTAMIYLALAGLIIGFVATFFTLRYMPYKVYTEPLLMEELIGVIGFALYRILIPVLTSVLVAARCSAAVSADLGNKTYGGQIETLKLIHIPPARYLLTSVVWSFMLGTLLLNQVAFLFAKMSSLAVHLALQPKLGASYWGMYFHLPLQVPGSICFAGFGWMTMKLLFSAMGTAILTYHLALRPKLASTDVSKTITTTILWSTLWVLIVHMLVAFFEFDVIS